MCVCFIAQSCLTLCDPMDCSLPGSFVHGNSPDKNTGVGCHALLQWIFETQGSNPGLPHCRQILYCLSLQGKNPPAMWATWVRSLGWEDPLEEGMATHSSILARLPII